MRYLSKAFLMSILLALLFSALVFFNSASVNAQTDEQIDNAYNWLAEKVSQDWGNTEENAFSIMALKDYNPVLAEQGVNNLLQKSKNQECWPASTINCKIKDTALAIIALHEMGIDTSKAESWLLNQTKSAVSTKNWFLQFEIPGGDSGTCSVEYVFYGAEKKDTVTIGTDRKVKLNNPSSCLQVLSDKPWWVSIKDRADCIGREFYVNCQEPNWFANLLYISGTTFIPYPTINENTPVEERKLKVGNKCFPIYPGGDCDYDASLWASYALSLLGVESETKAYLESNADANKPLSYALIYLIENNVDFANKLADEQGAFGNWYYLDSSDLFRTAMAYYALKDTGLANLDKAKSWLLGEQNSDFSWGINQQRDTAAILYAVFSLAPIIPEETCYDAGYECCLRTAEGAELYPEFTCDIGFCASDCAIYSSDTCGQVLSIGPSACCDVAAEGAELYPELDFTCSEGKFCASECVEPTCTGEGHMCCDVAAEGAELYPYLDNTCSEGQVCASECISEITGPFNFSISAWPASHSIHAGQSADYLITVLLVNGTAEEVFFNLTAFNSTGIVNFSEEIGSFSFTPASGIPSNLFISTLRITTLDSSNGTYNLKINATNGSLSHYAVVQLFVIGKTTGVETQMCMDFVNYTCCPYNKIKLGAQEFALSCAPSWNERCVKKEDCLEIGERCGIDKGQCCADYNYPSNAERYPSLDETCNVSNHEVCVSSCNDITTQLTCSDLLGVCCEMSKVKGITYGGLGDYGCSYNEVCASSCETTTETIGGETGEGLTCYDVGVCCDKPASSASRFTEYDDTCPSGQVCASECAKKGSFLLFFVWFLIILALAGIVIVIYLLMKKKKSKGKEIPGLPLSMGKMPPPKRPLPLFKRPATPKGPSLMPRTRTLPPITRGMPLKTGPSVRPMFTRSPTFARTRLPRKPIGPPKLPIAPIMPSKKERVTKKGEAESELAKTLKELGKIARAKTRTKTTKKKK
ncbi:hypothetical protein B6U80_01595 [Candidatus Pacearchaeota archaeon ex4484_26]|nr:MAG: hypothetical protein B6U80_01595 [Candidatus Pacearchaeota archaeon ex4484_26]